MSQIETPVFKIRCSAIYDIMAGGTWSGEITDAQKRELKGLKDRVKLTDKQKEKLDSLEGKLNAPSTLGEGAKTYVRKWFKEIIYQRRIEVYTPSMAKGHIMEDDGIEMIRKHYGKPALLKNTKSFDNGYIIGTPDVIVKDRVIDDKNPESFQTFPLLHTPKELPKYEAQIQGYMELVGVDLGDVVYTLNNTPEQMIESSARRYCNLYDLNMTSKIFNKFKDSMTYDNIPFEDKIRVFEFKKNDEFINRVVQRVRLCREYVKELTTIYNSRG